jgi:MFS family permease
VRSVAASDERWLTPGVRGIGLASLLSDMGHEIPTALLPSFVTHTLGAPAAALGLIEGVSDGLSGAAKVGGGALADDPHRRRAIAVGGYSTTAVLSGLIGIAGNAAQVGLLRAGAWTARGLRGPSRNALLADVVQPSAYGRAYGFERAMDNLGAILGPLLALALVAGVGVRGAILLSSIPGFGAVVAIVYAVRHVERPATRQRVPLRLRVRPVLAVRPLRRLLGGVSVFELGNVAATLLILRATTLLDDRWSNETATLVAILLYAGYNLAATVTSVPAGHLVDRRGPVLTLRLGVATFLGAYAVFAVTGPSVPLLALGFLASGVGIGCVETAENAAVAALAPTEIRGSAFGVLAAVQSVGNLVASGVVGVLFTVASPAAGFSVAAALMGASLAVLLRTASARPSAP